MDRFDSISPIDFRYYGGNPRLYERLRPYLSERAYVTYCTKVEVALVRGLVRRRLCSPTVLTQLEEAAGSVTPDEVYAEEARIHHYNKALVNCLRRGVSPEAQPYVHLFATSADIADTANSLRLRDFTLEVLIPDLLDLERILIDLAQRNARVPQIGRTHGQHALPITFGFALAGYVDRIGERIGTVRAAASNLRGMLSGAVGAYNAFALALPDPDFFEEEVLADLGLKPGRHSTQIVQPEYLADLVYHLIACLGVLANLSDDMRHLQRTEIGEVAEAFATEQVGSSTMPHKRNPWNFEHVKSLWKEFTPRLLSVLSNQISEHQRDLTNSASGRFVPEIFAGFADAVDRLRAITKRVSVNEVRMAANVRTTRGEYSAEALYVSLSLAGLPEAHERVRDLATSARERGTTVLEEAYRDKLLEPYISKLTTEQLEIIENPEQYLGAAVAKTEQICSYWEGFLFS